MRLTVADLQPQESAEFAQFLGLLSSLTGEEVECQIGPQGVTFDISTTQLLSVVKFLRSGKSSDSSPQVSPPLKLRLNVERHSNGSVTASVYSDERTGVLEGAVSLCMRADENWWKNTTFTVDTSPRLTSTESTSSLDKSSISSRKRSGLGLGKDEL